MESVSKVRYGVMVDGGLIYIFVVCAMTEKWS